MRIGGFIMKNILGFFSALMTFGAVLILYAALLGLAFGVMYESARLIITNN